MDAWNKDNIYSSMQQKGIEWFFNPPAASHFGGAWEREIRTARKIFYSIMMEHPRSLNDEVLSTVFCEVEAIMNNRPLTPVSCDPNDLRPLTPNHLILLSESTLLPPGIFTADDSYGVKRWKTVQHLANQFWQRWKREYLKDIQLRNKWQIDTEPLKVNDLVLIVDNLAPRNCLLYTSPSPRDKRQSRMPSSA